MLLKLGVSLNGLQQREVACATYQGNRQALPQIVGCAEAAGQAGRGAGRLLAALAGPIDSDRIFKQFDLAARRGVVAAVPAAATRWHCCFF